MYFQVLKEVADRLNKIGCPWAIGGSLVLYFKGIWECPNDIDVLVDAKYADDIKRVMKDLGKEIPLKSKAPFTTEKFFGYDVNGIEIEFMGDFKINTGENQEYRFILDEKAIVDRIDVQGSTVNVTSLEDWMVAYSVMTDPKKRVPIIKEYFKRNGLEHKNLLERNLEGEISEDIKDEIKEFISI